MRVAALLNSVRSATTRCASASTRSANTWANANARRSPCAPNDRLKDEFLAILAHELRNPLAPITNALRLLKLGDSSETEVAQIGQMMERQVGNLRHLVDDLHWRSRASRAARSSCARNWSSWLPSSVPPSKPAVR